MFDTVVERQVIPDDLETIPPGPFLVVILSGIDRSMLNGHDAVRVMQSHARLEAHFAAEKIAVMAEVAYCPPGSPHADVVRDREEVEFGSVEIGAALCLTRRAADSELGFALELRQRLPQVWELLDTGRIDVRRARIIVHGTDHLDIDTARQVVERIIEAAPNLTTGQLRARIQRLCVDTDPDEAKTRYDQALSDRRVVIESAFDGTANLYAMVLPADRAAAIRQHLHGSALALKTAGENRMDQLRTDVFLDLLDGNHSGPTTNSGGVVDVQIPLATLVGVDNLAVEIPGLGPVLAQVGRNIAAQGRRRMAIHGH